MRTDRTGPLHVGQVLIGLLDDLDVPGPGDGETELESARQAAATPTVEPQRPLTLLERMLAVAEQTFDADDE